MALNRFGWLYWVWLVVLGLVGLSLREQLIWLATCREGAVSLLGLLKFLIPNWLLVTIASAPHDGRGHEVNTHF